MRIGAGRNLTDDGERGGINNEQGLLTFGEDEQSGLRGFGAVRYRAAEKAE